MSFHSVYGAPQHFTAREVDHSSELKRPLLRGSLRNTLVVSVFLFLFVFLFV